jgi:hypothetical protein
VRHPWGGTGKLVAGSERLELFLPVVVDPPDLLKAVELRGLVGLAGDRSVEVGRADGGGEAASVLRGDGGNRRKPYR